MVEPPGDLQTIDDLLALIALEPEARDVFVESRADALLIDMVLRESGVTASVSAVSDRMYIPRELCDSDGDYGEREKLVTIARFVEAAEPRDVSRVTVVVDSDWSHVVGPQSLARTCILMTDFPSMEFYFLQPAPFERFQRLGLHRRPISSDDAMRLIGPALLDIAAVRLALREFNVACWARFSELWVESAPHSGIDARELLRRSFSPTREVFEYAVLVSEGYREMLRRAGHQGRGHDIAPLLIRVFGLRNDLGKAEIVERLMRSTAATRELLTFPMFSRLVSRVAA